MFLFVDLNCVLGGFWILMVYVYFDLGVRFWIWIDGFFSLCIVLVIWSKGENG